VEVVLVNLFIQELVMHYQDQVEQAVVEQVELLQVELQEQLILAAVEAEQIMLLVDLLVYLMVVQEDQE
jgi:hypothetical protein